MLRKNTTILFQGDSITDAGRTYDASDSLLTNHLDKTNDLGYGYPYKVKQYLETFYKDLNITVLNRGVSGDRTINLKNRWDKDCIDLKPDYLSILIGINDTWRRYDNNDVTTVQQYEDNFRYILATAKKELDCKFIILEPFLIPTDKEKDCWREDLNPKIQVARKLAREFDAIFIPFDGIFASECVNTQPSILSADGVHPTDKGHSLIAKVWLDTMLKG